MLKLNDALNAVPVVLPDYEQLNLYLVGCGGTGSWLAPSLVRIVRLLEADDRSVALTLIDFDTVESGNIPRQNFIDADLGLNKAEVLALRYGTAWGVEIGVINQPFEPEQITTGYKTLSVIIGAVDRASARQQIAQLLEQHRSHSMEQRCWWVDCGNAETSGQVLIGSTTRRNEIENGFACTGTRKKQQPLFCRALPAPHLQHPELLEPLPHELSERSQSCRELTLSNRQSLFINQRVATEAAALLNELLLGRNLKIFATYFDVQAHSASVSYISKETSLRCFDRSL
jgi:PRTRC genetic system ThiF family protein